MTELERCDEEIRDHEGKLRSGHKDVAGLCRALLDWRTERRLLENGNATMDVWLGKNILGQTDEVHHQIDARSVSVCVMVPGSSPSPSETLKQIDDENTIDVKGARTLSRRQKKDPKRLGHRPPASYAE
jgi:hypothetical protein